MKYRKKPVEVEAHQWFQNGDHPEDNYKQNGYEGEIVRRYRHPDVEGTTICSKCDCYMHDHGWIDTLEGGHIVCVGDWIITGIAGEKYPCKPDIFEQTYKPVDEPCSNNPSEQSRNRLYDAARLAVDFLARNPTEENKQKAIALIERGYADSLKDSVK